MVRLLFKIGVAFAIMLAAKPVTAADAEQETYSWTGPYVGINLGGAKGNSTVKDLSPPPGYNNLVGETWSFRNHGFTGGAQAGYNLQAGVFLLGGELDLGYLGLDQSKRSPQGVILFGGDTRAKVETDFYTAARLRIGLAANTVLLYGTGGWIGVDTETSVVDPCNTPPCGPLRLNAKSSEFRSGWTAGGGIEIGFTHSISCKLEYMFVDLGTEKVNDLGVATNFTFPGAWDISTRAHMFRFGLNYRF